MKAKKVFENMNFKRSGDVQNTLGIGKEWRIHSFKDSYQFARNKFHGYLRDAQKYAAKELLDAYDYQTLNSDKAKLSDWWASISEWNEKYQNLGDFYKDENGRTLQRDEWYGGWDELFAERIKLDKIDIVKLRFDDKLEFLDKGKNND